MWFVVIVFTLPLLMVMLNRWRLDIAGLFLIVVLGLAQFLGLDVLSESRSASAPLIAISGFSQPVVITLIGLFILTQTLIHNGVVLWIGKRLSQVGKNSVVRLVFLFTLTSALLSLFMNNVMVGALLLPSAMHVVRQSKIRASKLLIPIAFGTALGGMATYFTTANIVVSNLLTAAEPPQPPLGVLSFALTGGLIAVIGIAYMMLFGTRLLPVREPGPEQSIARRASAELEDLYSVGERLWEARLEPDSALIGQSIQRCGIGEKYGIVIAAVRHGRNAFFVPLLSEILQADDVLLVVGREERVMTLNQMGFQLKPENHSLTTFGLTLIETILAPHSLYVGKTLKELNFHRRYGFLAIALLRHQRSYRTDVASQALESGDSLLMVGPQSRIRDLRSNPNLVIFEADPASLPIPRIRAMVSILLFSCAIILALFGIPIYLSVMAAALMTVLLGYLPLQEVYRSIEWQIIFSIAGMYAASLAMVHTGLADLISRNILEVIGANGPLGLSASAYLLSAALTQVMGSQAAVFVVGPIAISAAIHLHTNPQAIAVATAIGCSASFLTPIAHPINLLIMGPGNYRSSDLLRIGFGLMVVVLLGLYAGMILFWNL